MALKKGRWRAFRNIPVFWVHQRTTNLDKSELVFHLVLNLFAAVLIFTLFSSFEVFDKLWIRGVIALAGARTASWILNDHLWGGLLVSFSFVKNRGPQSFIRYMAGSAQRLALCSSISTCLVYGSLVRGQYHLKSDLDILYIRRPGLANAVTALSFAVRERLIALLTRIPLDLYVRDSSNAFKRYRDDEVPIVIKDDTGAAAAFYHTSVPFATFVKDFSTTVIKEVT